MSALSIVEYSGTFNNNQVEKIQEIENGANTSTLKQAESTVRPVSDTLSNNEVIVNNEMLPKHVTDYPEDEGPGQEDIKENKED